MSVGASVFGADVASALFMPLPHPFELCLCRPERTVVCEHVEWLVLRHVLGRLECRRDILRYLGIDASILEAHLQVVCTESPCKDKKTLSLASKTLEVDIPDPGDIASVVVVVVDDNIGSLRTLVLEQELDILVEACRILSKVEHDLAAIQGKIKGARILENEKDISDWNAGKVQVLLAHPASVGYGLNLQEGGHVIVWYGLTWSLELYQQANARLYRQGQEKPVIIHHLIAEGTADEEVMAALQNKDTSQAALLAALKERRAK